MKEIKALFYITKDNKKSPLYLVSQGNNNWMMYFLDFFGEDNNKLYTFLNEEDAKKCYEISAEELLITNKL